jgi:hypothetical protein
MSIIESFYNLAHKFPGGARALALLMGKNPTTLSHELTGTGTAKLGLVDAIAMVKAAREQELPHALVPIHALCRELGGMFVQLPQGVDAGDDTLRHLANVAAELGDVAREVDERTRDGDVSDNDLRAIEPQALEVVAAIDRLMSNLRARNAAAKPSHLKVAA